MNLLVSLYLGFTIASTCTSYQPPQSYLDLKSTIESKLKTFANKKSIAKEADETLSKLITAKSPFITNWFEKRNLNSKSSKSEDEIVLEWRQYFAKSFILSKYPYSKSEINTEIETLMDSVNKLVTSPDFQKKMETLFSKSKEAALSTIKTFPLKEAQKTKIIERIKKINLYWMKDFKTSKFKELPLDFLDWGIAYDPSSNEINMGVNALSYPNEETYLAVFAHEIGHSFDSCRWGAFFDGDWPFQKVGECLRSSESVGAKKRDDSKLEQFEKEKKLSSEWVLALKTNPTCNKLIYPPVGIQADQLPESFSDWFSAETMSQFKNLEIKNLRADLCEKKELIPGSSYPAHDQRLNKIYFTHPKLQTLQKESGTGKYCGL